jgi:murein DD-endopeptidase MepM/ murein hydrolase activator NlpD
VRGRRVSVARSVVFLGRAGRFDDVVARVRPRSRSSVTAEVPRRARSGPIALVSGLGTPSRRWRGLVVARAPKPITGEVQRGPVSVIPHKFFYGALRKAEFTYQLSPGAPTDVIVSLVRSSDGAVVRAWRQTQAAPGAPIKLAWDGTAGGRVQSEGLYLFRVAPTASGSAAAGATVGESSFAFYDHIFPVRGSHDYGGAGARFGAGRGGRSHQGQDVFSPCGTPLVAARSGKVVYAGYHSLAGYYVVIRGEGSGLDYAYMHLRGPAMVKTSDRVYTGQPLGEVGESGNAHGCHLHFELWSAPGWYNGGRALDPLPELRRWDRSS